MEWPVSGCSTDVQGIAKPIFAAMIDGKVFHAMIGRACWAHWGFLLVPASAFHPIFSNLIPKLPTRAAKITDG